MKVELSQRYCRGEMIPARDFNTREDLVFFGKRVWEDFKQSRAVGQYGLDRELYWKNLIPAIELTPEEEHLVRPTNEELRWSKRLL